MPSQRIAATASFPYRGVMATPPIDNSHRIIVRFGIFYSLVILSLGLWVSVVTGDWIAMLLALGLVVLPVGGIAAYNRRPTR